MNAFAGEGPYRLTHSPSGPSFTHVWLCEADGDGDGSGLGDDEDVGDGIGELDRIGAVEPGLEGEGVGLTAGLWWWLPAVPGPVGPVTPAGSPNEGSGSGARE